MLDRSLPLLEQGQRELSNLLLKSQHPGFQGSQSLDLVCFLRVGEGERTSCGNWLSFIFRPRESLHWRGDRRRRGCTSQNRRLKCAAMQAGYLVQVLLRHTFDAGIRRVGGQRKIGLFEPVAECFGMNAEQTSTVCDRKGSHDRVSFRVETKRHTRETTGEISRNSDTSRKFPGRLGGKTMGSNYRWKRAKKPGLASLQTTFRVVIAGMTLMAATPPRPGQDPTGRRRRGPDEPCKQMAHFWDGQGKHGRASGKPRWSRRRSGETLCRTNPCQEGKSHQHQRDVSVPTDEATNFVMVQPQVFGVFKILFDVPACTNGRNHLRQGRSFWSKDEVVRFLVGISEATTNEHPMASIIFPSMQHGHTSPVK